MTATGWQRITRRLRGVLVWLRFILRLLLGLLLLPLLLVGLLLGRLRWRLLFRRELRRCGVPAAAARELSATADLVGGLWRGWRQRHRHD